MASIGRDLTPQQVAFLNHPDALVYPKKAALDVGFSQNFAEKAAHQLRDRYMPELVEKMRARMEELGVTPEWVKNEVVTLARTAPADFFELVEDDKGNQYTVLQKFEDIDKKKWRAAVKEVEFDTYIGGDGALRSRVAKIKFYDRQSALVELANLFGMKNEKVLLAIQQQEAGAKTDDERLLEEMSPEELEEIARIQEAATERMRNRAGKKRDAKAIEGTVVSGGTVAVADRSPVTRKKRMESDES